MHILMILEELNGKDFLPGLKQLLQVWQSLSSILEFQGCLWLEMIFFFFFGIKFLIAYFFLSLLDFLDSRGH